MERPPSSASRAVHRTSLLPHRTSPGASPSLQKSARMASTLSGSPSRRSPQLRSESSRGFRGNSDMSMPDLGDLVYVKGNLRGVILYIGPIDGKEGDFVGVDLLGEDAGHGLNDGSVNGVRYFNASHQNSGMFVRVGAVSTTPSAPTPLPGTTPRAVSSLANRAPSRASSSLADRSGAVSPSPVKAVVANGYHTPRRKSSMISGLAASGRTSRAGSRPSHAPLFSPPTQSGPQTPSAAFVKRRQSNIGLQTRTNGGRSTLSVAVDTQSEDDRAYSVDSGEIAALQEQVANLKIELSGKSKMLEQRESDLASQSAVLLDLENTLSEFQSLSDPQVVDARIDEPPLSQRELDLRTLIMDKDAKLEELKVELDAKRREFRETMEALEQASLATTQVYESQIAELRAQVDDYSSSSYAGRSTSLDENLVSLETAVAELEKGLQEAQTREQRLRDELTMLEASSSKKDELIASLESRILDLEGSGISNDDTLSSEQLVYERQKREAAESELHNLERMLESRVFREQELEKEVIALRDELSAAQDKLADTEAGSQLRTESRSTSPVKLNGHTKTSPTIPELPSQNGNLWCDICQQTGHDILDCPKGSYGINASSSRQSSNNKAPSLVKSEAPGRKLWCALCEKDGHSSMDCPEGGL